MATLPQAEQFKAALQQFAESLKENWSLSIDAQSEDQLKAPVTTLLNKLGTTLALTVNARTEAQLDIFTIQGRPDIGVSVQKLLCGYVELKAPGLGARTERFKGANKAQWEKFKPLPNLLYTDAIEWALYRGGERIGDVVTLDGDPTGLGAKAIKSPTIPKLFKLLQDFLFWEPIPPDSPKALAHVLAPLTRMLRDEVLEIIEQPNSGLKQLEREWRDFLFPNVDDQQFADAYAQTLTYGLLLARFSSRGEINLETAWQKLENEHALLAQALKVLSDKQALDEIGLPVRVLARMIHPIRRDDLTKRGRDPWLYFYEEFLGAYDPALRRNRGVYYTPVEVIQCQVSLVATLLQSKLSKPLAFADDGVVFLDPATGTGAYPLVALEKAFELTRDSLGAGAIASRATVAASNLHAFEILIGPYAVAHLRLTEAIRSAGGRLPEAGLQVFLTDTLESPFATSPKHQTLLHRRLNTEHLRAADVKKRVKVIVCMGNPPYDRQEITEEEVGTVKRKGGWVRFGDANSPGEPILEDFLRPARELGFGVHLKNLYNDYVYFWRWALWKVFEQQKGPGIVSFITASSYLRGPAFVGMRSLMRRTFNELWIIDLEGDSHGARKTENVFNIATGVAIAIGVRYEGDRDTHSRAKSHYAKIEGTQDQKLEQLAKVKTFSGLKWQDCFDGDTDPFLPKTRGNYFRWPALTDLFPWQHSGAEMKRTWVIAPTKELLEDRWHAFCHLPATDRPRAFRETRDRKVDGTYSEILGSKKLTPLGKEGAKSPVPEMVRYAFRSFDYQWTFFDHRLGDYPRPTLWAIRNDQQIYLVTMLTDVLGFGQAAIATCDVPDLHCLSGRGAKDVIPLWRDSSHAVPNVTHGLLQLLTSNYHYDVAPEDLLGYVYAVLAGASYSDEFHDELAIPGPRIPLTRDKKVFRAAATLGKQLVSLHTLGQRLVPANWKGIPQGRARCTKAISEDPKLYPSTTEHLANGSKLIIGSGTIEPVGLDVWEYEVSGRKALQSWLSYRLRDGAGKQSSPLDKIRPKGWPASFTQELLQLIWVFEATLSWRSSLDHALQQILASELFVATDLPKPGPSERKAPMIEASDQQEIDVD